MWLRMALVGVLVAVSSSQALAWRGARRACRAQARCCTQPAESQAGVPRFSRVPYYTAASYWARYWEEHPEECENGGVIFSGVTPRIIIQEEEEELLF